MDESPSIRRAPSRVLSRKRRCMLCTRDRRCQRIHGLLECSGAMSEPRPTPSRRRILRGASVVLLTLGLAVTVATYYDALGQYATGDQMTTLRRLDEFARAPTTVRITDGSNVSRLLFALP